MSDHLTEIRAGLGAGGTASPVGNFQILASRVAMATAVGEHLAAHVSEIVIETGLDPHQLVAAVASAVEIFAKKHATFDQRPRLIRRVADRIARRAPKFGAAERHEVPVGRTFGEIKLLQALSRLVADVDAAMKLMPDVWHPSDEPLATCRRLMAEAGFRRCQVCGCSEFDACVDAGTPCGWIKDDLCSRCAGANHPGAGH